MRSIHSLNLGTPKQIWPYIFLGDLNQRYSRRLSITILQSWESYAQSTKRVPHTHITRVDGFLNKGFSALFPRSALQVLQNFYIGETETTSPSNMATKPPTKKPIPKKPTPIKERPVKLPKGNKIPAGIKKVYGFK